MEISCGRGGGLHHLATPAATRHAVDRPRFRGACDRLLPATVCAGGQSPLRARERAPFALQRARNRCRRERRGVARLWRRCGLSARGGAGPAPRRPVPLCGLPHPSQGAPAGAAGARRRARGELRDITPNVVSACELDAERRRGIIRSGVPWYYRLLFSGSFERYSGYTGNGHLRALPQRRSHLFPDLHDARGFCLSGACSLKEPAEWPWRRGCVALLLRVRRVRALFRDRPALRGS